MNGLHSSPSPAYSLQDPNFKPPQNTSVQFASVLLQLLDLSQVLCFEPVPFFFFYTVKTGLHNTNLTVVDFGLKDRATQVIARYEITCSCCWIKIAKIHAYKQKVSSIEAVFSRYKTLRGLWGLS